MTDSEETLKYTLDSASEASISADISGPSNANLTTSRTEPAPNLIMSMMMTLLQKTQEDAVRREEEAMRREAERKREEKKRVERRLRERKEDLERLRIEDLERLDMSQQVESEWRKQRAKVKDRQAKLAQALKTFPKLNNPSNLPTQLQNFSKVLDSCGITNENKASKLPEIFTGRLAVILRNVDLPEEIPFEEAKSKLLRAAGLTPRVLQRVLCIQIRSIFLK